jgi:hypothetical protein
MGTQYPVFKTTNFDVAVDSAGREDSSIENRLAALHDVEFAIGQQGTDSLVAPMLPVPIVNRRFSLATCRQPSPLNRSALYRDHR